MMSLTFGLFTQVSGSGPLGPLVLKFCFQFVFCSFDRLYLFIYEKLISVRTKHKVGKVTATIISWL